LEQAQSHVAVVVAALNEEKGIGPTLEELQSVLGSARIVVVDGNSVDKTVEIAKNLGADVVLQDGTGKGNALFQGLQQLSSKARYVVFTDADFTYPAEYVPKMIEVLERNSDVGMVIGDRFKGDVNFEKTWKNPFYLGNRLIALAQRTLNGIALSDPLSGLRVVRTDIFNNWKPKSSGFDVEAEINFLVEREGYRIVEIPIDYRTRIGEKKLKLRHGFGILKRIMSESITIN
jgi:dolichol-phosphate hexosyltransferase